MSELAMWVYGDGERIEAADTLHARIADGLASLGNMPSGLARHEYLIGQFLSAGELVQGLADREFEAEGADDFNLFQDAGGRLLIMLAQAVIVSWRSAFDALPPLEGRWLSLLRQAPCGGPLRLRQPEGFAFYALYPEAFAEAALCSGLSSETSVTGLRSIGTSLGAIVAAALGSNRVSFVRPTGDPFNRSLSIRSNMAQNMLAGEDHAIVDEGPGLSGSSFGSVADWLEDNGVPRRRIHFFPSHGGSLGPHARPSHIARWNERPRHIVGTDDLIISASNPAHRLETWVAGVAGSAVTACQDVSGGGWRELTAGRFKEQPPSQMQMEKRKFIMQLDSGERVLVKFSGLDEISRRKGHKARLLSEAGFTCCHIGQVHGFHVESWRDGKPLNYADRHVILERLTSYLTFRFTHLATPLRQGAALEDLTRMSCHNIGEWLGASAAAASRRLTSDSLSRTGTLPQLDVDGRLHEWEWLVAEDGSFFKTDALDHSAAHDMVGPQPAGWDVAGAVVEFGMSCNERTHLAADIMRRVDCDLRDEVLDMFETCYTGYQIGAWTNAKANVDAAEIKRIDRQLERYRMRLLSKLSTL